LHARVLGQAEGVVVTTAAIMVMVVKDAVT
jgi:hypothetical protein